MSMHCELVIIMIVIVTVYETIMIFKITIIHLISLKVIVEVTFIVILLIIMTTTERNLYESDC